MKHTFSAGGVVVGPTGKVAVVDQHSNSWSLPKGHIEAGETEQQAAAREIREEIGISNSTLVKKLGTYSRSRIGKDPRVDDTSEQKTITVFLYQTDHQDLKPTGRYHKQALWIEPDKVADLLTHPKDKEFYKSIQDEVIAFAGTDKNF